MKKIIISAVLIVGLGLFALQLKAQSGGEISVSQFFAALQEYKASLTDQAQTFGGTVENVAMTFVNGIKAGIQGYQVIDKNGFFVTDKGRVTYGVVRLDFTSSATTSQAVLLGKAVNVYDAYFVMTGAPTTTSATANPSMRVGTSSAAFISNDSDGTYPSGDCGLAATCAAATAHDASILNTGIIPGGSSGSQNSATGTVFSKADYQGTDTRDASGARYVVPVAATEYITAYASSSIPSTGTTHAYDDITGNGRAFTGYVIVKYFTLQ
jgi:hypothetical protein